MALVSSGTAGETIAGGIESIDLLACLHCPQSGYHSVSDITIVTISNGQCATRDNCRENLRGGGDTQEQILCKGLMSGGEGKISNGVDMKLRNATHSHASFNATLLPLFWWLADQFSVWQNCPGGDIWDYCCAGGLRLLGQSESRAPLLLYFVFYWKRPKTKGRFARNTNYAGRKKKTLSERNDSKSFSSC